MMIKMNQGRNSLSLAERNKRKELEEIKSLTTCRAFAIRAALKHIADLGTTSISLKEIQDVLNLSTNQMYTVRREINTQNESDTGRGRYLHPKDMRLVVHIPPKEDNPNVIMAVEAALLNLELEDEDRKVIKNLLTDFLREALAKEITKPEEKSHA
jgi:hypothetical protein